MKLYELNWGDKFRFVGQDTVYTLERGDGMYMWVSWQVGTEKKIGQLYLGEKVERVK